MNVPDLVGRATPEETEQLFRESFAALTHETVMDILKELLTIDDIDELTNALP